MNINIERKDLLQALNLVSSVVEKKQTLPILANLYISHVDGNATIVGTDLEVEISQVMSGVQGENGAFTLSSEKIVNITRMLPEDSTISFKRDSDSILVSSGRSRYKLKGMAADDFPRIEAENWEERFKINEASLKSLLDKTSFAMASQDVRYYLNGILLEFGNGKLAAIATDGHRLAQSDVDIQLESNELRQVIVPRKAITEINRFLDTGSDMELVVEVSKNHLKLTKGETILITKLIDGKFPELKSVLETDLSVILSVNRTEFIDAMNRAAVLVTERFKGVKIELESGVMRVTVNNPEQEEAVEELAVEYTGEAVETGYNIGYLIDAARVVESDNIELCLQGNDGICIIKQPEDSRSTWLVMPMRI